MVVLANFADERDLGKSEIGSEFWDTYPNSVSELFEILPRSVPSRKANPAAKRVPLQEPAVGNVLTDAIQKADLIYL